MTTAGNTDGPTAKAKPGVTCLVGQASLALTHTHVWGSWVGWLFSTPVAQEL